MPKTGHHYPFKIAKDCQKCRSQHGQTTDPHTWCTIPLISLLESARKGMLTTKGATESAQQAIELKGNTSTNMSVERWWKAATHLNHELATLMEDEDVFAGAAPKLFGKSFDKNHMEAIRSLNKTSLPVTGGWSFQRAHPNIPGMWHLQGQRRIQEVQDHSVMERTHYPLWYLMFKI